MKFGHQYQQALASEDFPEHWRESAIEYKHLKKCIRKIHDELKGIGLDAETLRRMSEWMDEPAVGQDDLHHKDYYSAAEPTLTSIPEEFTPQLRVLVDSKTAMPLDATLTPETRASLQKLARHEMVTAGRRDHLGDRLRRPVLHRVDTDDGEGTATPQTSSLSTESIATPLNLSLSTQDARWVRVPLASAKDFFDLLEPKLQELEALRAAETQKLEDDVLDLGDAVEDVVEPVREGFEARRSVSYRDLYFWREMFRLYMERPVFYSETDARRGALTFKETQSRLRAYDAQLRETGLLAKMRTPRAKQAAKMFHDLNVDILRIMHFQEMNAKAMRKILKKFDKRTHLEGEPFLKTLQAKYPALLTNSKCVAGGFADSIARDLSAEIATKVLAIPPQPDDWICPVCYSLAWRPVNLGCCRSVFCIQCIIKIQGEGVKKCPVCNKETVLQADGRNIDFEAMDFLEKYFPLETKKRQEENERATLAEQREEETGKVGCRTM